MEPYAMEIMHNIGHLHAKVVLLQAKIAESERFLDGAELNLAGTAKSVSSTELTRRHARKKLATNSKFSQLLRVAS